MSAIEVSVATNILPPLSMSSDAQPAGAAGGLDLSGLVLSLIRPRVRIVTPLGTVDKAPWGQPREGTWKLVLVGVVVAAGVLAVLTWRGVRSFLT